MGSDEIETKRLIAERERETVSKKPSGEIEKKELGVSDWQKDRVWSGLSFGVYLFIYFNNKIKGAESGSYGPYDVGIEQRWIWCLRPKWVETLFVFNLTIK